MTKQEYIDKMEEYKEEFDILWGKIANETNGVIKYNPDIDWYSMQGSVVEKMVTDLILSGAWIKDRIDGKNIVPSNPKFNRSLTKKISKVLDF